MGTSTGKTTLNQASVASGLSGHRAIAAIPADGGRRAGKDALDALSATTRAYREPVTRPTHADSATPHDDRSFAPAETRRKGTDQRQGAPSSAFLAQHIAQEIDPLAPGPDAYQAGARAYIFRRDSTVEILSSAARLDVYI